MTAPFAYYRIRHLIPRPLQVGVRRLVARRAWRRASDTWPIDAGAARKPAGFPGWPDGKRFAFVLRHDVESREGVTRCGQLADLESRFGLRSGFFFVPERYGPTDDVRRDLVRRGLEVGVHGLTHDGMLYSSYDVFHSRALRINEYMREWGAGGFVSPSAHHNYEWLHEICMDYDSSSFDTDPFEPQPDGLGTIFPMMIWNAPRTHSYVELPYTLSQDFTLFVVLRRRDISMWTRKFDWVAERGGMALLNTHPDYMHFAGSTRRPYTYEADLYADFLNYVRTRYESSCWHALPREVAAFWRGATEGGVACR